MWLTFEEIIRLSLSDSVLGITFILIVVGLLFIFYSAVSLLAEKIFDNEEE